MLVVIIAFKAIPAPGALWKSDSIHPVTRETYANPPLRPTEDIQVGEGVVDGLEPFNLIRSREIRSRSLWISLSLDHWSLTIPNCHLKLHSWVVWVYSSIYLWAVPVRTSKMTCKDEVWDLQPDSHVIRAFEYMEYNLELLRAGEYAGILSPRRRIS